MRNLREWLSVCHRMIRKVHTVAIVAMLIAGAAAQQRASHGGAMKPEPADDPLTREIKAREMRIWNAYRQHDLAAHNALLSEQYRAVGPDGSIHGRPAAQEFAKQPMSGFRFSDFRAEALGEHFAHVSYVADVEGPGPDGKLLHARYVVGEIWVLEAGEWKCRNYQPTVVP